jgi:hypothetical protein
MLIASDLLLLLTDDETGKLLAPPSQLDIALGGALLLELQSQAESPSPARERPCDKDG